MELYRVIGTDSQGNRVALGRSDTRRGKNRWGDGQVYNVHPDSDRVMLFTEKDAKIWVDYHNSPQAQSINPLRQSWHMETWA